VLGCGTSVVANEGSRVVNNLSCEPQLTITISCLQSVNDFHNQNCEVRVVPGRGMSVEPRVCDTNTTDYIFPNHTPSSMSPDVSCCSPTSFLLAPPGLNVLYSQFWQFPPLHYPPALAIGCVPSLLHLVPPRRLHIEVKSHVPVDI